MLTKQYRGDPQSRDPKSYPHLWPELDSGCREEIKEWAREQEARKAYRAPSKDLATMKNIEIKDWYYRAPSKDLATMKNIEIGKRAQKQESSKADSFLGGASLFKDSCQIAEVHKTVKDTKHLATKGFSNDRSDHSTTSMKNSCRSIDFPVANKKLAEEEISFKVGVGIFVVHGRYNWKYKT